MKTPVKILLAALLFTPIASPLKANDNFTKATKEQNTPAVTQYCILKCDDFEPFYTKSKEWANYVNFINLIKKKNIVAALGIIGKSTEKRTSSEFATFVKELDKSGKFEFWNHGYDHGWNRKDAEFMGKPYEYQFQKMTATQEIAKREFGIVMHTFGSPGNIFDEATAKVINDIPEMKVWLFNGSIPAPKGKLGLPQRIDIEHKINNARHPNLERFQRRYSPTDKVFVCQMHPHRWYAPEDLPEFEKFIDFLLAKGVKFILPYDYYKLVMPDSDKNNSKP